MTPDGNITKEISRFIGVKTNNQAEYEALIAALREVNKSRLRPVVIQTDSELLFYQLSGKYRVKDEKLKPLFNQAKNLLSRSPAVKLKMVPRKTNSLSDRLAKKASAIGNEIISG
jgi:ribonuclease HI